MFIYKITNLINTKSYIGLDSGSPTENRRWKDHRYNRNKRNSAITRALCKYSVENFSYKIIDTAETLEELIEKEKYWISFHGTKTCGYNCNDGGQYRTAKTKTDISALTSQRNLARWASATQEDRKAHGEKVSAAFSVEEKQRRRERALAQWKRPEVVKKMKAGLKTSAQSEHRKAIASQNLKNVKPENKFCKQYKVFSPTGEIFNIRNLRQFCHEHQLHYECMVNISNGKLRSWKNWSCEKINGTF